MCFIYLYIPYIYSYEFVFEAVTIRKSLGVWDLMKLKGMSTSTTSPENGFDRCKKPEVTGMLGNNRLGTETRERES